jgi:phosphoenolpyruvate-protein kinase (PTS system EI component)
VTATFHGIPVSPGRAAGTLRVVRDPGSAVSSTGTPGTVTAEDITKAFAAVARQRSALAARLRADGRSEEAGIIDIAALIAADPVLSGPAADAVRDGADPVLAVRESAERQAAIMEELPDATLAARAADIRQIATAVADFLRTPMASSSPATSSPGPFILVRPDVSPAELIQLADSTPGNACDSSGPDQTNLMHRGAGTGELDSNDLVGVVSVEGGASSHAAIIARGLGLPMITGVGPAILDLPSGESAVLDADTGELRVGDGRDESAVDMPIATSTALPPGRDDDAEADNSKKRDAQAGAGPVRTVDGVAVSVLCNVASAAETRRGLAAGAEGVGLLRTEIPFVDAADWPGFGVQRDHLAPILAQLTERTATVRLLDFSGDKIPPFLADLPPGTPAGAGLAALLGHPTALADQLRAILTAGRGARLKILIPMVRRVSEIERVREVLRTVAAELAFGPESALPPVGIMVELADTAANAAGFAAEADFFSIGTNDLTGDVLGLTRSDPAAGPALAADPRVLALVRNVADAGQAAGIGVSVCGDAAGDPRVLPLLIGAGIREVSVAAARVATGRSAISELNAATCAGLTARALD